MSERPMQRAIGLQQFDDRLVRLEDRESLVGGQAVVNAARIVDIAGLIEAIAAAGIEVVRAMSGRRVDSAGTLLRGHVIGVDAEDRALQKRMLKRHAIEPFAGETGDLDRLLQIACLACGSSQRIGNDVHIAVHMS